LSISTKQNHQLEKDIIEKDAQIKVLELKLYSTEDFLKKQHDENELLENAIKLAKKENEIYKVIEENTGVEHKYSPKLASGKWFGFKLDKLFYMRYNKLNLDTSFLLLREDDFNTYDMHIQNKLLEIISTYSHDCNSKVFLKILNKFYKSTYKCFIPKLIDQCIKIYGTELILEKERRITYNYMKENYGDLLKFAGMLQTHTCKSNASNFTIVNVIRYLNHYRGVLIDSPNCTLKETRPLQIRVKTDEEIVEDDIYDQVLYAQYEHPNLQPTNSETITNITNSDNNTLNNN